MGGAAADTNNCEDDLVEVQNEEAVETELLS